MGESPIVVTLSAAGLPSFLAAALTTPIHAPYNDVYEVNAPLTPTVQQRQQPRRTHIEAASAGISPPRSRIPSAEPKHNPQLTTDFERTTAPQLSWHLVFHTTPPKLRGVLTDRYGSPKIEAVLFCTHSKKPYATQTPSPQTWLRRTPRCQISWAEGNPPRQAMAALAVVGPKWLPGPLGLQESGDQGI